MIEVPTPEPGPGEVRVRVRASSVNGFDVFVAKGMATGMMEHRYPVMVGKDYAGEIDALGEGVTGFAVGDEVTGIVPTEPHLWRGAYAEFVAVPAGRLHRAQAGEPRLRAGGMPGLAALTAFQCVETIEASEGDVELVVGATGGVGCVRRAARRCSRSQGRRVGAASGRGLDPWARRGRDRGLLGRRRGGHAANGIPRGSTA